MALNRFMHPRNMYKTPPDFAKLAKEYKEFSEIANVDVSGKFSIDFKDPSALRVLTKCLLKSDFNVDIEIPEGKLVPTLPLRLNYILWIEDLLNAIDRNDSVIGLDIGTGACAIYPILASVKNKWHMVATESDEDSFITAKSNVERNNLQDRITLIKNDSSSVLDVVLQDQNEQKFHFCMCNPPFYSTFQDLWDSRSPARPPPKNGFTGSPQELITEGGELQFCRKIMEESKKYKDNILIFTTMVGHKYNLKELVLDMKAEGIKHTTTEFCQGRVTRWGLAWTYQDFDISKLMPSRDKVRKRSLPLTFTLPKLPEAENNIDPVMEKFETILLSLKIAYKIVYKIKHEITLDIMALINTWSNQRRKRRLIKKNQVKSNSMKKLKLNMDDNNTTISSNPSHSDPGVSMEVIHTPINDKETEVNEHTSAIEPIVHAVVEIKNRDDNINVDMEYLDGSAGKEGLHQILQYIKNNWKQ